ncbi:MAG: DUF5995 family protein [Acidimicrobiales bacterium]
MTAATTVDEVILRLDEVVASCWDRRDRNGFFAAVYRTVTVKIREGIDTGFFDDGPRMARLDVAFANRYLAAHQEFVGGRRPTRSWALAFETAAEACPIVLQHVLLGISAHINLDLGIAAAGVAPGPALPRLRRDFDRVNEILALLVEQIETDLHAVSPLLGLLDAAGGGHDEAVIRFSIQVARTQAWRFAVELAPLARADWSGPIRARDFRVARVGGAIRNPGLGPSAALFVIRAAETPDVRRVITVLKGMEPPSLDQADARVRDERAGGD